jgi:hypothetical protein
MIVNQFIGQAVDSLKSSPVVLALILLNVIMVSAAMWFLSALAVAQQGRFETLLKACIARMP